MYLKHFNLSDPPFTIAPNPRYLYLSGQHREALAHLTYGLNEKHGSFILLTGEVGTGKTTVCRCLLEQIPKGVHVALVLNPRLNEQELLETICSELGIDCPEHATSKVLIDRLNQWLLDRHSKGQHTVVIIEEAQNLNPRILEQLRLLTNLETNEQKLVQFILIGQPELLEQLARPELRQLAQRIVARYHLTVLTPQEVRSYIDHRFQIAGGNPKVFSAAVTLRIAQLSKGIPRVINLLCDRALLGCYAQNKNEVTLKILEQGAVEVFGDKQKLMRKELTGTDSAMRHWIIASIGLAVLVGFFYLVYQKPSLFLSRFPPEASSMQKGQDKAGETSMLSAGLALGQFGAASSNVNSNEGHEVLPRKVQDLALQASTVGLENGTWGESDAYSTLFKLWGLDLSQSNDQTPCEFAQSKGLDCWHRRGTFTDIQRINRPVILKMISQEGKIFFVALVERGSRSRWTVAAGTVQMAVAQDRIEKFWTEEYALLWKRPIYYLRTVRPGDRGPIMTWLNQQLALFNKNEVNAKFNSAYDNGVMQQVRQLQRRCGLQVDGLLGKETVILFNTINASAPLLSQNRQNILCPRANV